jgi:hypothetical protein
MLQVDEASLLMLDVSGFTALNERMAASGRGGAERVVHFLNQVCEQA